MRDIKALKKAIGQGIGSFSKREFREAYTYALHKHRENPLIKRNYYLALVIAGIINQNRFSMYTEMKCQEVNLQRKRAV